MDTSTKPCQMNQTRRRGYMRKNGVYVKPTCVPKQMGATRCKNGETPRVAHTRRYMEGGIQKTAHIPASCVKRKSLIGPLRKGDLKKYGYSYKKAGEERRGALQKAVQAYGALTTYHKLNAVAKLSENKYPAISRIFSEDRNWIHTTYSKNGILH